MIQVAIRHQPEQKKRITEWQLIPQRYIVSTECSIMRLLARRSDTF